MKRLVWHRRDLRLADSELYQEADEIYSVYIFEDELQPRTSVGGVKSLTHGPHYVRELLHALSLLRTGLQELGGNLIIRSGDPAAVLPQLAQELGVNEIAWNEIPGTYELAESARVKESFQLGHFVCNIRTSCALTLFHPDDLPRDEYTWSSLARPKEKKKKRKPKPNTNGDELSIIIDVSSTRFAGMPTIMGDFRRAAKTAAKVRLCLPKPTKGVVGNTDKIDCEQIPSFNELAHSIVGVSLLSLSEELTKNLLQHAGTSTQPILSSEDEILAELQTFCLNHASTADRGLADVSDHNSSRLSIYLSFGLISPRQVHHLAEECSISWLQSHMEMRDFFLYDCLRKADKAFRREGQPTHKPETERKWFSLKDKRREFERWATGKTGLPLVDAGMREMIATGYVSNRVRQNMASVLTKDLQIDWRLGAEWFQICLADHCVAANYGNWAYFSGVGSDPKNRHFRTVSQAIKYDPEGIYVRKWNPLLKDHSDIELLLRPWDFLSDWETPIVDPSTQLTWHDTETLIETGRIIQNGGE